jgi:predicted DNA-binding transcriptional regulator YafY
MSYSLIFKGKSALGGTFTIEDDGHDNYPICFGEADVSQEVAVEAAYAVLKHIGAPAHDAPAHDAVLASDVSFNEALLRLAAIHERTVEFRYAKGTGYVIETRQLVPQDVRQVGDHLTFTGYDPDRNDVRAYRVDRMKGEVTVK